MATKTTTKKTATKTVAKKSTTKSVAKRQRISVNAFEKVAKANSNSKTITWNDIEITITPSLSLKDMMRFVSNVVSLCFVGKDNAYHPEVKDFAVKANVLEMYANFTLPKDINKQYEFIYNTDAFETVLMNVNPHQFPEVMVAIDKKLENLAASSVADAERRMNDLLSSVESIGTQLESVFSGIDAETMTGIAEALKDGKIDEAKLMESYMSKKYDESVVEIPESAGE